MQITCKSIFDDRENILKICAGFVENYKVVRVADVVLGFERMLHKLVKLVHVYIHQKLAGEIAEGEPLRTP